MKQHFSHNTKALGSQIAVALAQEIRKTDGNINNIEYTGYNQGVEGSAPHIIIITIMIFTTVVGAPRQHTITTVLFYQKNIKIMLGYHSKQSSIPNRGLSKPKPECPTQIHIQQWLSLLINWQRQPSRP